MQKKFRFGFTVLVAFLVIGARPSFAGPGDGLHFGNLVLHPFLDGSYSYDSNAGLLQRTEYEPSEIEDEDIYEDDTFTEFRLGLNGDYKKELFLFNGSVWWYDRRYDEFTDFNEDGIGERAALNMGDRDSLLVELHQSSEHITDYSRQPTLLNVFNPSAQQLYLTEDRTDRLERELFTYGGRASRDFGDRWELELGGQVFDVDYAPEELYDTQDKTVEAQLGYRMTDKTTTFLRGRLGQESNESYADDADYTTLQVGLRSRASEKLVYNLAVGMEEYNTPMADTTETEKEKNMNFDLSAIWRLNYKTSIQLTGQNYIQSSSFSDANTRDTTLGQISLLRRLSEAWSLGLSGSFRMDDYRKPLETRYGLIEEERETIAGNITLNFAPQAEWYRLYAQASMEDSESNIPEEDYEQIRYSLGASLYY